MSDITVSNEVSENGTALEIRLCGRLAIDTGSELLEILKKHLPLKQKINIDVSRLSEIDITGMQIFCSACRTAMENSQIFTFTGSIPVCIKESINKMGLQNHTNCERNVDIPCIWLGGIN